MSRVMVVFGGRSGEHEVSLASARAVIEALGNDGRHEVVPVGITRSGKWLSSDDPMRELTSATEARALEPRQTSSGDDAPRTTVETRLERSAEQLPESIGGVDVVFPVMHGPYGEDGRIQGLLEMAGIPYVGSGVLASAVAMDKVTMKKVFAHHGLPQVRWVGLTNLEWVSDRARWTKKIVEEIGFPCFVKPSNLGSSVGISRADSPEELGDAVDKAVGFDRRVIIEQGVDAREVEVSALGNGEPDISVPGEVVIREADFYDYEAKYGDDGMDLIAPADIPNGITQEIRRIAKEAFTSVDAAGMSRIDFFLERGSDRLFLNEINTIPGFTATSVYAKLWQASGLEYPDLLDRLVKLALERHSQA